MHSKYLVFIRNKKLHISVKSRIYRFLNHTPFLTWIKRHIYIEFCLNLEVNSVFAIGLHVFDGERLRGRPERGGLTAWKKSVPPYNSHFLTQTDWPRTDLVGGQWFIDLVQLQLLERADQPSLSSSSSSLSSSAPISEHSRLHKLTPLWTILRTHPRCVETKVMGPKVELHWTEPCPPWSTCPASPIRRRTIDGYWLRQWLISSSPRH